MPSELKMRMCGLLGIQIAVIQRERKAKLHSAYRIYRENFIQIWHFIENPFEHRMFFIYIYTYAT